MIKKFASWIESFSFAILLVQNTVIISWNPNTEPDLAGYKLYYGTESKRYNSVIDVGLETSYTLEDLVGGNDYFFAVTAYDTAKNESYFSEEVSIYIEPDDSQNSSTSSDSVEKYYNFPNPFNPQKEVTHIRYVLSKPELVTIKIFDIFGECIRSVIENKYKSAGEHIEDVWDGKNSKGYLVQNGIYYCIVKTVSKKNLVTIAVLK